VSETHSKAKRERKVAIWGTPPEVGTHCLFDRNGNLWHLHSGVYRVASVQPKPYIAKHPEHTLTLVDVGKGAGDDKVRVVANQAQQE
jgi:sugar lactone lactonase YvrE